MIIVFTVCFQSLFLLVIVDEGPTDGEKRCMNTEVIMLATLHRYHREVPFYSLDHLWRLVKVIDPDIICAEIPPYRYLTNEHLEGRPDLTEVLMPYARLHACHLWPLEPGEPERSAFLARQTPNFPACSSVSSMSTLKTDGILGVCEDLMSSWGSIQDIHSRHTGEDIRSWMHERENVLGERETMAWVDWNIYYLSRMIEGIQTYPHRRFLVAVGVDHFYWLKGYVSGIAGVKMRDIGDVLKTWHPEGSGETNLPRVLEPAKNG